MMEQKSAGLPVIGIVHAVGEHIDGLEVAVQHVMCVAVRQALHQLLHVELHLHQAVHIESP